MGGFALASGGGGTVDADEQGWDGVADQPMMREFSVSIHDRSMCVSLVPDIVRVDVVSLSFFGSSSQVFPFL